MNTFTTWIAFAAVIAVGVIPPATQQVGRIQHYSLPSDMNQEQATCLKNGGNYYQYPEPTCVFLYS